MCAGVNRTKPDPGFSGFPPRYGCSRQIQQKVTQQSGSTGADLGVNPKVILSRALIRPVEVR